MIVNPHLEGEPFYWEGGPVGVLLVHGFTATTAEVRPLARYLYGRGYSVCGPLLPGHGAQPAAVNRYTWRDWVRAVEECYRHIAARCDRVIVGGESAGALLSLYLASEHPEVTAVLGYAPALMLPINRFDRLRLHASAPFVPYIAKKPGAASEADALWQGYHVRPLKGVIELLRLQRETRPRLSAITQPILIVQGRLDGTIVPDSARVVYEGVRSTVKELHWMEQSGHCVILDCQREHIFELTAQFLARVPA
jgi:carboxylesterase